MTIQVIMSLLISALLRIHGISGSRGYPIRSAFGWPSHHHKKESSAARPPIDLAKGTFSVLAKRRRTWNRLMHMVDLVLHSKLNIRTVADIGTDHGLLAMSLALSKQFDKVVGIDISRQALENGALKLLSEVQHYRSIHAFEEPIPPLHFRHGDGLRAVQLGEADAVCIAGVGCDTITRIVSPTPGECILKELGCRQLVLQPTTSRPRNLIFLYQSLRTCGWYPSEERLEHVSGRWYLSVSFHHKKGLDHDVPYHQPLEIFASDALMRERAVFCNYLNHHCNWMVQDSEMGQLNDSETQWLETFDHMRLKIIEGKGSQ